MSPIDFRVPGKCIVRLPPSIANLKVSFIAYVLRKTRKFDCCLHRYHFRTPWLISGGAQTESCDGVAVADSLVNVKRFAKFCDRRLRTSLDDIAGNAGIEGCAWGKADADVDGSRRAGSVCGWMAGELDEAPISFFFFCGTPFAWQRQFSAGARGELVEGCFPRWTMNGV